MAALFCGCGGAVQDARSGQLQSVFGRADELLIRSRPKLVAGKYQRMASAPFEYYRGNLAVFRADWELGDTSVTAFPESLAPVWGLGDPHPENFGILVAGDGTGTFEPNDFDSADRVPALFDLRRLLGGLAIYGHETKLDDTAIDQLTRCATAGWLEALGATDAEVAMSGAAAPLPPMVSDDRNPVMADLFRRSSRDRDERAELGGLTVVTDGVRAFRRGVLDAEEPTQTLGDLPATARGAIEAVLPQPKDVVREYGSGVASWPRIRVLALLEGPTESVDDDVVVEVKEISESALAGWYAPTLAARDAGERLIAAAHRAWSRPDADPRYAVSSVLGLPVLIRTESEANKNVRLTRLTGDRGSVPSQLGFARVVGRRLGQVHAGQGVKVPADLEGFAAEQSTFARAQLQSVLSDLALFRALLTDAGPTLGLQPSPNDQPPADFAALIGSPL